MADSRLPNGFRCRTRSCRTDRCKARAVCRCRSCKHRPPCRRSSESHGTDSGSACNTSRRFPRRPLPRRRRHSRTGNRIPCRRRSSHPSIHLPRTRTLDSRRPRDQLMSGRPPMGRHSRPQLGEWSTNHRPPPRASQVGARHRPAGCASLVGCVSARPRLTQRGQVSPPHTRVRRSRSAFPITDTELNAIAAAAIVGVRSAPKNGYSTPAAIGTPRLL